MVLGQLRAETADLLQGGSAHGIVRTDAERRQTAVVPGLERAMHARLGVEPAARRPALGGVAVADARCRDVADLGIGERPQHVEQIAGLRHVVGVELHDKVVTGIAVVIIEVGEIAFLAARTPRPAGPVIVGTALAGRQQHAMRPRTRRWSRPRGLRRPARCRGERLGRASPPRSRRPRRKGSDGALVTTMAMRLPAGSKSGPAGLRARRNTTTK